jgi:hypothetical protein
MGAADVRCGALNCGGGGGVARCVVYTPRAGKRGGGFHASGLGLDIGGGRGAVSPSSLSSWEGLGKISSK